MPGRRFQRRPGSPVAITYDPGFFIKVEVAMEMATEERFLTLREVAERLKVNEDTVRRLFSNEPGVIVICFPRKGKRVYRTLRIPESVLRRVLTRLMKVG